MVRVKFLNRLFGYKEAGRDLLLLKLEEQIAFLQLEIELLRAQNSEILQTLKRYTECARRNGCDLK